IFPNTARNCESAGGTIVSYQIIGQSIPRVDNPGKVTRDARYTADVLLPGTLWAKTLRSPYPHARIARVDTSRAEKAPGVRAILTGADVRGILYGRRYRDISVLAQDRVRFIGERVAAVAADTLEQAEEALEFLEVDYEELPAIFDPVAALQEGAPIIHPDVNSYPGLPKPLARRSHRRVDLLLARLAHRPSGENGHGISRGVCRRCAATRRRHTVEDWRQARRNDGRSRDGSVPRQRRLRRFQARGSRRRHRSRGRLLSRRACSDRGFARVHEQSSRRSDESAGRTTGILRRGIAHGLRGAKARNGPL